MRKNINPDLSPGQRYLGEWGVHHPISGEIAIPLILRTEVRNMETLPEWAKGFDRKSIEDQAAANEILPQIDLPKKDNGEIVNVRFSSEPFLIENEKLVGGKAWFVKATAWKLEGSELDGQILLPDGLMRELLVLMERTKLRVLSGLKVKIFRQEYEHKTFGRVVGWRVAKL